VIALHGEHDPSTTPYLQARTSEIWWRRTRAVVGFSNASLIGCSVINWLLRAHQALVPANLAVCIVERSPERIASRMIDALGLPDTVACYRRRDDALAATPRETGRVIRSSSNAAEPGRTFDNPQKPRSAASEPASNERARA
jgi:hypothetical protein